MNADFFLKICCSMIINAVIFGIGAVTVLAIPSLARHAVYLLPAVVVVSFAAAPFIAAVVAPRMRYRNWGREAWLKGDTISG
jgi:hypothetical protein